MDATHGTGPQRPDHIIDEVLEQLDIQHKAHVDRAAEISVAREVIASARPHWAALADGNAGTTQVPAVYASGVTLLETYRDEVRDNAKIVVGLANTSRSPLDSAMTLFAATGSTASFTTTSIPLPPLPDVARSLERHEVYAARLHTLDPQLAQTYRAIWEILRVTRKDPERGALWQIRQAFDHLFAILAPDESVRLSKYWAAKVDGPSPLAVTRKERLTYAANTVVKSFARKATLLAATEHMIDVYQSLNIAHKRGEIDAVKARTALEEMRQIIEEWADAVV
jgi:hypothetical protein